MSHPVDFQKLAENYLDHLTKANTELAETKRALDASRQYAREVREQGNDFLERLTKAAHEKADEQNWCSEFDEFMESFGLAGRSKDYQVTVITTITYSTTVKARDEEAAEELAHDQAEEEWSNGNVDINDIETLEVEEV